MYTLSPSPWRPSPAPSPTQLASPSPRSSPLASRGKRRRALSAHPQPHPRTPLLEAGRSGSMKNLDAILLPTEKASPLSARSPNLHLPAPRKTNNSSPLKRPYPTSDVSPSHNLPSTPAAAKDSPALPLPGRTRPIDLPTVSPLTPNLFDRTLPLSTISTPHDLVGEGVVGVGVGVGASPGLPSEIFGSWLSPAERRRGLWGTPARSDESPEKRVKRFDVIENGKERESEEKENAHIFSGVAEERGLGLMFDSPFSPHAYTSSPTSPADVASEGVGLGTRAAAVDLRTPSPPPPTSITLSLEHALTPLQLTSPTPANSEEEAQATSGSPTPEPLLNLNLNRTSPPPTSPPPLKRRRLLPELTEEEHDVLVNVLAPSPDTSFDLPKPSDGSQDLSEEGDGDGDGGGDGVSLGGVIGLRFALLGPLVRGKPTLVRKGRDAEQVVVVGGEGALGLVLEPDEQDEADEDDAAAV